MDASKMMGFESPGDQRVPITVREWNGLRLALWRSKAAWEIATREANAILDQCDHVDGCPGVGLETAPCLSGCPDREVRMSALVVLNAARMFAPLDARKAANDPYMAPSREFFSEVVAGLAATQAENEVLRAALRQAGVEVPSPPPTVAPALPTQRTAPQLAPAQPEEST